MLAPFRRKRTSEVNQCTLAGVVGDGLDSRWITAQPCDRSDVDDPTMLVGDHAGPPDRLAEQENASDVEVHHLVPCLDRMTLSRGAPRGTGIVDQDVDLLQPVQCFGANVFHLIRPRRVSGYPLRVDAARGQGRCGGFEVGRLSRRDYNACAGLSEAFCELQSKPPRTASYQRRLAAQIE